MFRGQPGGAADGPKGNPRHEREVLVRILEREVASTERYHDDLTICVVGVSGFAQLPREVRTGAIEHLRVSLDRVVRTSDFVSPLPNGRFAVVLARCNAGQGRQFGSRLTKATANRPLVIESQPEPFVVAANFAATQYDQHRFYGPLDFLEAAEQRPPSDEVQLKDLRDSRTLRQRLITDMREAEAA